MNSNEDQKGEAHGSVEIDVRHVIIEPWGEYLCTHVDANARANI